MRLIIEIRAAEGGDDAKALVTDQAGIYEQFFKRIGATVQDSHVGHG